MSEMRSETARLTTVLRGITRMTSRIAKLQRQVTSIRQELAGSNAILIANQAEHRRYFDGFYRRLTAEEHCILASVK